VKLPSHYVGPNFLISVLFCKDFSIFLSPILLFFAYISGSFVAMNRPWISGSILIRSLLILAGALCFGFCLLMWQFNRPPFDLTKLKALKPAMTQQQVQAVLGNPTTRDASSWHYSRPMAWAIVHVRFDAQGNLQSHEYDY
jgi:hypothetical protein